jgi:hypothetical protein
LMHAKFRRLCSRWLILWATLSTVSAAGFYFLDGQSSILAGQPWDWRARGAFEVVQNPPSLFAEATEPLYWESIPGARGFLMSPQFAAPAFLSVQIKGSTIQRGHDLYLELEDGKSRVPIQVPTANIWRTFTCHVPTRWQGRQIRLVAAVADGADKTSLGVSSLRGYDFIFLVRKQITALLSLAWYPVTLLLFLCPGFAIALILVRRNTCAPPNAAIMAVAISCLTSYVVFWCYFVNPVFGQVSGIVVLGTGFVSLLVVLRVRPDLRALCRDVDILVPVMLMGLVGLFDLAMLDLADIGMPWEMTPRLRFTDQSLPFDSLIPMLFASRLWHGIDPRLVFADWHSSDRPPLQTGVFLVQWSVAAWTRIPMGAQYQFVGTAAQCSWIPAVWAFCRSRRLSPGKSATVLCFLVFSGFFVIHSVFVWPKMLAGALALWAFTLGLPGEVNRPFYAVMVILGLAAALALLAHGGSLFTLLALALLLLMPHRFPGVLRLMTAASACAVVLLPWLAYQRYYDPPGNRLLKWHLAHAIDIDSRSSWQSVVDAYRSAGAARVLRNKLANAKLLFVGDGGESAMYPPSPDSDGGRLLGIDFRDLRRRESHNLLPALGILNVGWLVGIMLWLKGEMSSVSCIVRSALGLGFLNLAIWLLLMFGPATTTLHQGPFACFFLLFIAPAACLAVLPAPWPTILVAVQGTWFLLIWIVTSPANAFGPINAGVAVLLAFLAACVIAWCRAPAGKAARLYAYHDPGPILIDHPSRQSGH